MRVLLITFVLLMVGCSSAPSHYYSLLNVKQPHSTYPSKGKSIGVEQVIMPKNLSGRRLFIATANHQIKNVSGARWAQNLDTELTHRLIEFLQKKFTQPSVYLYPWETSVAPDVKLTLNITRFIASEGQVHLQANWIIGNLTEAKRNTHLFNTMVATNMRVDDVVRAMDLGFSQLEAKIALTIKQY